jgi:DNA (cytosine-5)-methyltransferase 1
MAKLNVIDLFCGTGGFSYGFENHPSGRFRVVFGNDILEASLETFQLNHPSASTLAQDIRTLRPRNLPKMIGIDRDDVDIIVGGPPCQGFSSIRPFRSTNDDDPRNSLFEEFASYVNYFRPRAFVLENVVGLATHKGAATLEAIESCFASLEYRVAWYILNTAHFGIPQKRERFVMIGVHSDYDLLFPEPSHDYRGNTIGIAKRSKMLLPEQPGLFSESALSPALTTMDGIGDLPAISSGEASAGYGNSKPKNEYQRDRRKGASSLTLHKSTGHSEKMLQIIRQAGSNIYALPPGTVTSGFSSCYSRLDPNEPSVTITVNFVHPASNKCIHPLQDRALTPREGARLQGFDDSFGFCGNRAQIVKQIGNAVPPLLGRAIADAVLTSLEPRRQKHRLFRYRSIEPIVKVQSKRLKTG